MILIAYYSSQELKSGQTMGVLQRLQPALPNLHIHLKGAGVLQFNKRWRLHLANLTSFLNTLNRHCS